MKIFSFAGNGLTVFQKTICGWQSGGVKWKEENVQGGVNQKAICKQSQQHQSNSIIRETSLYHKPKLCMSERASA